ncbi:hypothetical protein T439DRAFT_360191 [Meredithblackwellia eburnea MCA 4105]
MSSRMENKPNVRLIPQPRASNTNPTSSSTGSHRNVVEVSPSAPTEPDPLAHEALVKRLELTIVVIGVHVFGLNRFELGTELEEDAWETKFEDNNGDGKKQVELLCRKHSLRVGEAKELDVLGRHMEVWFKKDAELQQRGIVERDCLHALEVLEIPKVLPKVYSDHGVRLLLLWETSPNSSEVIKLHGQVVTEVSRIMKCIVGRKLVSMRWPCLIFIATTFQSTFDWFKNNKRALTIEFPIHRIKNGQPGQFTRRTDVLQEWLSVFLDTTSLEIFRDFLGITEDLRRAREKIEETQEKVQDETQTSVQEMLKDHQGHQHGERQTIKYEEAPKKIPKISKTVKFLLPHENGDRSD